jgi:hypothetical protein
LLERLGLTQQGDDTITDEEIFGRTLAVRAGRAELDRMRRCGDIAPPVFAEINGDLSVELERLEQQLAGSPTAESAPREDQLRRARRHVAIAERAALAAAARTGHISETVARDISADIAAAEGAADGADETASNVDG